MRYREQKAARYAAIDRAPRTGCGWVSIFSRRATELARNPKLTPVIDRRYPLNEAAEAIRYLEQGRARGKIVVTFE